MCVCVCIHIYIYICVCCQNICGGRPGAVQFASMLSLLLGEIFCARYTAAADAEGSSAPIVQQQWLRECMRACVSSKCERVCVTQRVQRKNPLANAVGRARVSCFA